MVDECFIVPLMFASQFTHVWLIQFNSIKFMDITKKKKTMRKNKKISKNIKYQLTITISRKTKTQSNPDIF